MALSRQNCTASFLHICGIFALHLCHKYVLVQCYKFSISVGKPMEVKSLSPLLRNSLISNAGLCKKCMPPATAWCWFVLEVRALFLSVSGIRIVLVSLPCVLYQGKLTAGAKQPKLLLQTIKIFRKVRVAPFFFFLLQCCSQITQCPWNAFGMDWDCLFLFLFPF